MLNGADMNHVAPPHSYINVQVYQNQILLQTFKYQKILKDFQSTKELAEYLHQVNNNDTLFASYFWWRNFYTVKVKVQKFWKTIFLSKSTFPSSGASTLLLGPLLYGGCGTSSVSLVQSLLQVASNQQNLPDNRSGEDIGQE